MRQMFQEIYLSVGSQDSPAFELRGIPFLIDLFDYSVLFVLFIFCFLFFVVMCFLLFIGSRLADLRDHRSLMDRWGACVWGR